MTYSKAGELLIACDETHTGERLDKVLAERLPELSRTRLKALILDGCVKMDSGILTKPSLKLEGDEIITVNVPEAVDDTPKPENIPLDIVYEDEHLLVINKPSGLVVHPAAGHHQGTLVNALLYHCKDTLSGIGGVKRPGIVHRLDQDTTGLMVVAKTDKAHAGLSEQLADKSMYRVYHALCLGRMIPPTGKIVRSLDRHSGNRLKQIVVKRGGREAVTNYRLLEGYKDELSLVECRLETGRTHQIRVHMLDRKNPIVCDPLYGPQPTAIKAALKRGGWDEEVEQKIMSFPRQLLHAKELGFIHPISGEKVLHEIDYPADFKEILELLHEKHIIFHTN